MLLTIDIGTSVFKSALWDFHGNRLSSAEVPLLINSRGARHEANSAQWLRAFEICAANLGNLSKVQAIVLSGNGPSLIPVFDEPELRRDNLLLNAAPARMWLDRRAAREAGEVSTVAGSFADASFFLPKALFIKNNEPELYGRTKYFLGCPEFLAFALCGQARFVFPSKGFEGWFWTEEILKRLKLDAAKFPPFIRPGETFGELLPAVASQFGFPQKIPVISGGPDFFAAIVGAGVRQPSQACDRTGTSEGINVCTENQINDRRLFSCGHPVEPYWNLSGVISTTGKAVEWGCKLFGLESLGEFSALAYNSEPGAGGLTFLPYLEGERSPVWDPAARSVWRGISLSSGRAEFARSVLEGICFAVRDVISVMKEAGADVKELRLTGGAAGNSVLNQIKADITGIPVLSLEQKEAELLGLAIIGSCALGRFESYSQAAGALVRVERTYEPDLKKAAFYNELFQKYRESYQKLYTP
ncbi:MAG: FGGY-family carbohydrate kinase [Treponema sp.]|nr:FGGY-family carbohydrate kinase [Treponema sp.]